MNRRDFIRQGSLWVAGALVVEPVVKRLWAFPTNPVRSLDYNRSPLGLIDCFDPARSTTTITLADTYGIDGAWADVFSAGSNTRYPCYWRGGRLVMDVTLKAGDMIELTYVPKMAQTRQAVVIA